MRKYGCAVYILLIALSAVSTTLSQSATARLYGTVFDPQRLVLPGVSIQVREVRIGISRNTISGADGYYEVQGLLPGDFEVTWELPGFSTGKTQVHLEVNQQVKLDLDMKVGDISTSVVVNASPPLLNSHDATLGTVIDQQKMESLPLNGRHFLELSLLTPGVHTSHGAQMGDRNPLYWRPGQNSAISVGGGRSNSNNYLLDGTINTDPSFNTYVISLSPDAVREFQTQSGTYSAEFGTAGTGVINVVTKSGTNEFHGSLYEYIRNSALDAREFTSPSKLPHFSQNQFGGTIGGPIQKEKIFFFGHYEGFRSVQGKSNIMTVPLMAFRAGDFRSYTPIYDPATTRSNSSFDPSKPASPTNPVLIRDQFPNNAIPPNRISPIALTVLQRFVPAPTFGSTLANNYKDNRAQRLNNDQYTVRLDRNLKNGNLFGRYSLSNEGGFTPENLPGFGAFHDNRVQNLTISHNWAISPRLINDLHVGLQRMRLLRVSENGKSGRDLVKELGIPGVGFGGPEAYGLPQFVVQGYTPLGDSLLATPVSYFNTMYQVGDSVARTAGAHSFKFGGDVRRFRWNMLGFFQNRGFFSFSPGFTTRTASNDGTGNALASFLLGLPAISTRQAGIPSMTMRQTSFSGFLQDDWRVRRNLTINLGIRYEMVTPLKDIRKVLSNLDFVDGRPVAYLSSQSGYPKGLQFADKNNVAPRIGFAYSPGNQHLVVRGGYGVFYGMDDMNTWCNQVHNVPLVFPETNQSDNFIPSIQGIGFGPAILGKTVVSFTGLDPHARTSYIQQYSLTLERQLGKNDLVQLGYAGSVGRKLQRAHLRNNATPAPGPLGPRRPFRTVSFSPDSQLPANLPFEVQSLTFPVSAINILENSANSSYNSGWVLWKRQLSHGLSLLTNYTYSKNLTDAPAFRSPANEPELPQNNSDLAAEKGLAGCHVGHRYVLSANYEVPIHSGVRLLGSSWASNILGDWKIATIYQVQSGFPFSISVFGDTANAGSILNAHPIRANQLPGVPVYLPSDQRSGDRWFNTAAFVAPPAFTFGNVGRNTVIGPSLHTCDLALIRDLRLKEAHQLQFRAEFFNLLNHTNFNTPNRYVNTPQFGSVTESATPARQIQFALRYRF
ncbi:MAG TPA: carboxypeptidase regulatory-like domain-containing protein [Acidobacteriota bacterium]|nr:carboxypeptidase regulatory-like domain-containing protein [Acidobacteriota bacterium]